MSTKRQPSKQRRQTQNRQQRAALQARRAAAAAEAPSGKVGGTAAAKPSGSVLSRLTGTGGAARRSTPSVSRRSAASAGKPPGHQAALMAVVLAGASLIFIAAQYRVPVNAAGESITTKMDLVGEWSLAALDATRALDGDGTTDAVLEQIDGEWMPNGQELYLPAEFPLSIGMVFPLIGAALGFRAVSRRASAKVVNRAMYAMLFGALLTLGLLIFFLPGVVAMAVASFQVRKAEMHANVAAAGDAAALDDDDLDEDDLDDDDVIEAELAEEDDELIEAELVDDDDDEDVADHDDEDEPPRP